MVDDSLTLRPHHALCIGFFRGKGYSDEFVENMAMVTRRLRAEDPSLSLRRTADAICRSCPNNCGGVCESADKVARYDDAVLRLTGLADGTQLHWSELRALARRHILEPGRLGEVCGDCQWFDICGNETK